MDDETINKEFSDSIIEDVTPRVQEIRILDESKEPFIPRAPDYRGTLDVAGWETKLIGKNGKSYVVIDIRIAQRCRLFKMVD